MEDGKVPREVPRARKFWQKAAVAATLLGVAAAVLHLLGGALWFFGDDARADHYSTWVFILSTGACRAHQGPDDGEKKKHDAAYRGISRQFSQQQKESRLEYRIQVLKKDCVYGPNGCGSESSKIGAIDCEEEESLKNRAESSIDGLPVDLFVVYEVTGGADDWTVTAKAMSSEHFIYEAKSDPCRSCSIERLASDAGRELKDYLQNHPLKYTIKFEGLEQNEFISIRQHIRPLLTHAEMGLLDHEPEHKWLFHQAVSGTWPFEAKVSASGLHYLLSKKKAWGVKLKQKGRILTLTRHYWPLRAVVSVALLLILVVGALATPSAIAVFRHGRILADHARNEDAQQGLLHLESARRHWLLRFAPEPPKWRKYERNFKAIERRLADRSRQEAQAAIEQAWALKRPYRAVALTDELLAALDGGRGWEAERQELLAERTRALAGPPLATVVGGQGHLEVHVGEHVDIGRENGDASGIVLSYQRASRLGKQCRLTARGGRVSVADLGSTNGSWLNDRELAMGGTAPIEPTGATLALGGERGLSPKRGFCRLLLLPCGRAGLFARVDAAGAGAIDVGAEWPNFEHERSARWLCVFPGGCVDVHLANDHSLTVEPAGAVALFRLHCGKGIEVGPAEDAESIVIDGEVIRAPVPWQPGAIVQAGGQEYQLREGGLS